MTFVYPFKVVAKPIYPVQLLKYLLYTIQFNLCKMSRKDSITCCLKDRTDSLILPNFTKLNNRFLNVLYDLWLA